jgi:hypothetical protein
MNEQEFSKALTTYLDDGSRLLDTRVTQRLAAGREHALSAYRAPVNVFGLATVSGQVRNPIWLMRQPLVWVSVLLMAAALWWAQPSPPDDLYDDVGLIDAKLLTSELPLDAYLDQDFATWMKEKEAEAR